ncbi:MAG: hypothetical protein KFH87_04940 [Bacteroidetes bacterium]|nr:hypothetical protein [Bacteroidota bacterium]
MHLLRKLCLLAIVLLLTAPPAQAQGVVTLDWGGSVLTTDVYDLHSAPIAHWYTRTRHQYLITPADFANIGLVPTGPVTFTSLAFYIEGWNGANTVGYGNFLIDEFNISMKNTTVTAVPSGFDNTGGFTQVYGPTPFDGNQYNVPGWVTHHFNSDFVWDGVSNILIDVCHQQTWTPDWDYTNTYAYRYGFPGSAGRQQYYYSDGLYNQICSYNYSYSDNALPNMQFGCGGSSSITAINAPGLVYVPNIIPINYQIGHPTDDFIGAIMFNLKTPQGQLVASETLSGINCVGGNIINGTYNFNAMNVAPGWHIIEAEFTVLNSCGFEDQVIIESAILLLPPGAEVCEVWPGDTDNNGVVNYADRAALNTYIHEANLRPTWLNGPQRFRADAASDPLTYLRWEMQPSAPWDTPEGCHMDTDGNGVINNFDYIAIKMNWLKIHGINPEKRSTAFSPVTFDMDQNFPNPFNPLTSIHYSVPERSQVRLVVTDVLGRDISILRDETVDAGVYTVQFDAGQLPSGNYIATVNMVGVESGILFNKTIKMLLSK